MIISHLHDHRKITQPLSPTDVLICGARPSCCKDEMRQHMWKALARCLAAELASIHQHPKYLIYFE